MVGSNGRIADRARRRQTGAGPDVRGRHGVTSAGSPPAVYQRTRDVQRRGRPDQRRGTRCKITARLEALSRTNSTTPATSSALPGASGRRSPSAPSSTRRHPRRGRRRLGSVGAGGPPSSIGQATRIDPITAGSAGRCGIRLLWGEITLGPCTSTHPASTAGWCERRSRGILGLDFRHRSKRDHMPYGSPGRPSHQLGGGAAPWPTHVALVPSGDDSTSNPLAIGRGRATEAV